MSNNSKFEWNYKEGKAELTVHWDCYYTDSDVVEWLSQKESPEEGVKQILRAAYEKETKVTPAILRKLFKSKTIQLERLNKNGWEAYSDAGRVELEKVRVDSWSGDEDTFRITLYIDGENHLIDIDPMTCERLLGDDAKGSSSRNIRCTSDDYRMVKELITGAIVE